MKGLTKAQQDVLAIAAKYAQARADQEHWRVNDPYPQGRWRRSVEQANKFLIALMVAACALEQRPTNPPDRVLFHQASGDA